MLQQDPEKQEKYSSLDVSRIQLDKELSNLSYQQSLPCFEQGPPKVSCSSVYSAVPHTTQMRDSRSADTERERKM